MERVLARRDDNWKKLQQYILDEREVAELRGPGNTRMWGQDREYTWFIRDGYFIRSPVKFDGVTIGEDERRKAEDQYLQLAQRRDARAAAREARPPASEPPPSGRHPGNVDGLIRQTRQPQFVSSAYFLRFKFDEGRARSSAANSSRAATSCASSYTNSTRAGRRAGRGGGGDPTANRSARRRSSGVS
jgi:hypothetical protein